MPLTPTTPGGIWAPNTRFGNSFSQTIDGFNTLLYGHETRVASSWSAGSALWGESSGERQLAMSFENVPVPNAAVITSATFTSSTVFSGTNGGDSTTVELELSASSARPSASNYPSSWTSTGVGATGQDLSAIQTHVVDITAAVQAVIDLGGWASGGRLNLHLRDNPLTTNAFALLNSGALTLDISW